MNALEKAIHAALETEGEQKKANKAYLEFIKANFIIPIEDTDDNAVQVLYLEEAGELFMPVFSNQLDLDRWVEPIQDRVKLLKLSGVDLLKGVEPNVNVALNIGSECYKIFNPAEIDRMRAMVLKFFKD